MWERCVGGGPDGAGEGRRGRIETFSWVFVEVQKLTGSFRGSMVLRVQPSDLDLNTAVSRGGVGKG